MRNYFHASCVRHRNQTWHVDLVDLVFSNCFAPSGLSDWRCREIFSESPVSSWCRATHFLVACDTLPDAVWHAVSGVTRLSCWPVDPSHTHSQGHIPVDVLTHSPGCMNTRSHACGSANKLTIIRGGEGGFHLFFPTQTRGIDCFLLARLSHFNPSSSCQREREGRKKDGSVSEEAHGSWGSLITVRAERASEGDRHAGWKTWEMECSRHGRNLSADMRWINLFSRLRFVVDTRLWRHILFGMDALRRRRQSPGQEGGEVNASCADKRIWIVHWITASLAAPRGPECLVETAELCIMKMLGLRRERQLVGSNPDAHRYKNHRSERSKGDWTPCVV